ncbi:MAG: hypothetical protein KC766_13840 [Myxococcales bacterium]|nr:hypothetical protein [Myxococcales bacterium]
MSRLIARATSALTALALFTAQLPALAQTKPEQIESGLNPERGSEEAVEQARKLVEEGDGLMKKSRFADGTAKYRAAWSLHATYFTACKAGRGEAQLEHYPEAAAFLAYCLKHFTLADDPKQKTAERKYRGLQGDVLKKVGRVEVLLTPKHASLSIDGDPLDDELFEGEIFVSPGEHKLSAAASGFVTATQNVSVEAGSTAEASLKLEVEAAAAPPAAAPASAAPSAPPPDSAPPETASPKTDSMTTRNIVVIAGGVLALGSLAGSFVFRAKATDKSDELSELRMGRPSDECSGIQTDFCSQLDSLQSDRESAASTSNVLLGVGVGLAVASVAAFFLWPKPKQESAARSAGSAGLRAVDLFVEHDRASLGFRGAF